ICGFIWPPASLAIRFGYWQGALEIIRHHPFGVGINGFPDAYLLYKSAGAGITQKTHNDFLQIGAEMGIIGLIVFVAIFGLILVRGLKAINRTDDIKEKAVLIGLVAGLAGFLVHCTVDFNFYVQGLSMSAWLVAGCLAAISYHKDTKNTEATPTKANKTKSILLLVICFLFLVILAGYVIPRLIEYDALLDEGKELVKSKNPAEVHEGIGKLQSALHSNPSSVDALVELAWAYHHNAGCKVKSKALYPKIPDTLTLTCIYCLDKAIELSPKTSILYYYRGLLHQDHANKDNAEKCFRKAQELYPTAEHPILSIHGDGPATEND
ncbi:MAG: O-antigen ligase family protein, partial [Planctomycetes bacterium]|nr:O-antigen ligase family protein [Planctomycetota bacterium]